jgi:hypothetical protein
VKLVVRAALSVALLLTGCTGAAIDLERLRQITDDHEAEAAEAAALGVLEDLALPGKGVVEGECAKALYEAWGRKDVAARAKEHTSAVSPCAIPCSDRASCEALGPDPIFAGALAPLRGEMNGADYAAARLLLAPTLPVAAGTDLESRWSALQGRVAAGLAVAPGPGDPPPVDPIAIRTSEGLESAAVQAAIEAVDVASCRGTDPAPVALRLVFDTSGQAVATKAGKGSGSPSTLECLEGALLAAKVSPIESWAVADVWWGPPPPPSEEPETEVSASVRKASKGQEEEILTVETARKIVKKNGGQVKYCYEQGLKNDPDLSGRLEVKMVIGTDGRVSSASASSSNLPSGVTDCVVAKVKRWTFTKPTAELVVEYPFVFAKSDR